ncbi:hypothetical protein B0H14DRAFT_3637229 [Mycena olivaceomarginata]|nr:hypothetical protein B0H14DRAFT_3637229 [Mycena olivaceomarginata]
MANSKLGHAVHPKQAHDTDAAHGGVLASILKQHPNLSVFHHAPAQQPSPPPSPTKSRHMNMFTKAYDESRASPVKLLPNKIKTTSGIQGNASQVPIGPFFLAGAGFGRVSSHDRLSPSVDALRSPEPPRAPLRAEDSPLKDPATGTRQDGRFFSPDAYKVLSLDTPHQFAMTHAFNTPVAPPDDAQTFLERLQSNASSSSMLSFASSVTPKSESTSDTSQLLLPQLEGWHLQPLAAPDFSTNLFDMSQELLILPPSETQGQRGANGMTSTPYRHKGKGKGQELDLEPLLLAHPNDFYAQEKTPRLAAHDCSNSFSFGNTMFYSLAHGERSSATSTSSVAVRADGGVESSPASAKNNSTASSPRPGTGMESPSLSSVASRRPEADINDESDLVIHADGNSANKHTHTPEQDSFSAHAHTYHTPQTDATSPQNERAQALRVSNADTGTDRYRDREIVAMQTQLALQTALCGQFETDLRARDELVAVLGSKLTEVLQARARAKRPGVLRAWRKKVEELERACRVLEEEAEGGALCEEEREPHREVELGWEEEKEGLLAAAETANLENAGLVEAVDRYKQQLKEHEDELLMLKAELVAQWDHAEKGTDKLEAAEVAKRAAEAECEALQAKVDELAEKMMEIDAEFESQNNHLENDIQELWDVKESLEQEREELLEQVRNREGHVKELQETLQAREDRIVELMQERQYALDNVARLEENIRRRDADAAEYSQRTLQREAEAEALREQLSRTKREHAGALDAVAAAAQAAADKRVRAANGQADDLKDEIERLRGQIHELQQESADKEVNIVQITKQRAQDKEDLKGLNIPLDSKQQELELLKRRMGVRRTAGLTPAQLSKIPRRRDSAVFNTRSIGSRPPPVLSDAGTGKRSADTNVAALGKSSCLNISSSMSSMGAPAPVTKPRASVATHGTRAPVRSASTRPATVAEAARPPPAAHLRVVSTTLKQATALTGKARQNVDASSAPDEKENVEGAAARVPVLAKDVTVARQQQ